MEHKTEIKQRSSRTPRGLLQIYLKVIALVLLSFSIGYWAQLVGVANPEVSFETMPGFWQATFAALVILQPIAALGLWGDTKWGIVIWIIVIAIELLMYAVEPEIFSAPERLLVFHIASFFLYLLLISLQFYAASRFANPAD